MEDFESSVHTSHFRERMAFEVCVNKSETLSLVKQITVKCKELMVLSNRLVDTLSVEEDDQSR